MISYPSSSREEFERILHASVESFSDNLLCRKMDRGELTIADYHAFLNMIFHQTFTGPATFAMAAANCDARYYQIRDYLIEHAEEEKSHWQWVIEDLRNTGFNGPDPRGVFPPPECQSYVAFNTYMSVKMPVARLGIAAVLEGIGAANGKKYAEKICKLLKLTPSQVKFIFGHGDTDVGHTADIIRVLSEAELTGYEWAWQCHAARSASRLYKQMYNGVVQ
jgi:hypothetical protein